MSSVENALEILYDTADVRRTLRTYEERRDYARFGRALIDAWEDGVLDDEDFRRRLCALSICSIWREG